MGGRQERRIPLVVVLIALLAVPFGGCVDDAGDEQRRSLRRAPSAVELTPREGASPVRFTDATADSGIDFVHDFGAAAQQWRYVESLGSGVVVFDGDGDGDQDLLFLNGRGFGPNAAPPRGNSYWRNEGSFRFVDATADSGLACDAYALAGCAGDYDRDGDQDVYVTHFDRLNALYRNAGNGRFEDVAVLAGACGPVGGIKAACAWGDVNGDGWLDLFVGACVAQSLENHRECWDSPFAEPETKLRRYCNPVDFEPLPDRLFVANADGTFHDASDSAGFSNVRIRTLGAVFVDIDADRDADLFVAGDRSPNVLWINDGKARFTNVALQAGMAYDADGRAQSGMGVTTGDYDGDGRIDVGVTYFEREPNGLYRQIEDGSFESTAASSNTGAMSFSSLGWGTEFFDADLDGQLDWIVANGHVQPDVERLRRRTESLLGWSQPPLFFLNRGGGQFESLGEEAGEPFAKSYPARGLATADFDDDGDLDVVITTNGGPALLLRNERPCAANHWLTVRLVGTKSNCDGFGARVLVTADGRTQIREVHSAGSFFSQSDPRACFGLGSAATIDVVEIRWPSGVTSRLESVNADQHLTLREE